MAVESDKQSVRPVAPVGGPSLRKGIARRVKNQLVPTGPALRRLYFGMGSGLNIVLDLQHWMLLYLGLYEIELNRHIRALCRPGDRCFDVGGENGYDALVLAKLSGADVMTFECDPLLCAAIGRSVGANPALEDLISVRCAVVDAVTDPGQGTIALDDVAYGDGAFVPDLIKIDIEGAEVAALNGSRRILAERRPSLIIEVHSLELERTCGQLLCDAGYRPRIVNPRRWLTDNRPVEHNRWLIAEGAPR